MKVSREFCAVFIIQVFILTNAEDSGHLNLNVGVVLSENNLIAQRFIKQAFHLFQSNLTLRIKFTVLREDADEKDICSQILTPVNHPQLILDATLSSHLSGSRIPALVRRFVRKSAVPTISTSYALEEKHDEWFNITSNESKYLIHIHQPSDVIPYIIEDIISSGNITSAILLYDDSFVLDHKMAQILTFAEENFRFQALKEPESFIHTLEESRALGLTNFLVLAKISNINKLLGGAATLGMFRFQNSWHMITKDRGDIKCEKCTHGSIMFYQPMRTKSLVYDHKVKFANVSTSQRVDAFFYYDLVRFIMRSVNDLNKAGKWPKKLEFPICGESASPKLRDQLSELELRNEMALEDFYGLYGQYIVRRVEQTNALRPSFDYQEIILRALRVQLWNFQPNENFLFGEWVAQPPGGRFMFTGSLQVAKRQFYKIVTIKQSPFIMRHTNGTWYGYCIDLLNLIQNELSEADKFDYEIYESPNGEYGDIDRKTGKWNGVIGEIQDKRAQIAIGGVFVMAEREAVVDFTVPYYDLVGISLLMKKTTAPSHMFKFLTVLSNSVWFAILIAYLLTSFVMFIFDRISPYSYRNLNSFMSLAEEHREFTLKECLWFCMTSITPQGGGEVPMSLSCRIVAASWWMFGFIVIASYTANLAAFLTVSRLDSPIDSLDKLAEQYRIRYAPVENSLSMIFLKRMAHIERLFFNVWQDMTLSEQQSPWERAKLSFWNYPMSQKYSDIWKQIHITGMPKTFEQGIKRVRASKNSREGFTLLGDSTKVRYAAMTHCDLEQVGEEFSRKPLALAVQEGSPLKDILSSAILKLLNLRKLESLKEKWWNNNPEKKNCEDPKKVNDGISIKNIGGVFIVISCGVSLASITLIYEQCFGKGRSTSDTRVIKELKSNHGSGTRFYGFTYPTRM